MSQHTIVRILRAFESESNPFERLQRVILLRDKMGMPMIEAHSHYYRLSVTVDKIPYMLYVPFGFGDEEFMGVVSRCNDTRREYSEVLTPADFLPCELRVRAPEGYTAHLDVVVERGNVTLYDKAVESVRKGRRDELRVWLKRLAKLAKWIVDCGLCHSLPTARNIAVEGDGGLRLRGYPFYCGTSLSGCYKTLLSTALAIYLLGSSPAVMLSLSGELVVSPSALGPMVAYLNRAVPVERRVADMADALLGPELDSNHLLSHLHLLTILPFEESLATPLRPLADQILLAEYERQMYAGVQRIEEADLDDGW